MTERVVPDYPEDGIPISGLDELHAHLHLLETAPSTPFNTKLLDDIELQLTETNIPPLLPSVLPPLTNILKSTEQDPTPLLSLTIKLLSPLPFTRALTIADPPSILAALASPLPGANLLALAIIHKAAQTPSDAAILSTLPAVVEELVRTWLDSPDVGVGERAAKVLGDLLETDCALLPPDAGAGAGVGAGAAPATRDSAALVNGHVNINGIQPVPRRAPGHARLWRLILLERPMLSLITTLCRPDLNAIPGASSSPDGEIDASRSRSPSPSPSPRSPRQASLAQGRLLRLLARLATLDVRAINRTEFPDLLAMPEHVVQVAGRGLLQWAAMAMVDRRGDVLMHLTLIDFFETLVSVMRVASRSAEEDATVRNLVRAAVQDDDQLREALASLPDKTVEEEAEALRGYIMNIMG
ncbi:hypothetical protein ESCO_003636 [Escovopsis weberi]|uniref:DNA mismatch repair protein HSM3 N-terminal domain-containing protein n=1 Tax=Escovopsis weberi TaxID=150374 RepID=A0A0M8N089_ESCWE|nr:hypothetical protein ESCO_003636 [Escovopsis weberi]